MNELDPVTQRDLQEVETRIRIDVMVNRMEVQMARAQLTLELYRALRLQAMVVLGLNLATVAIAFLLLLTVWSSIP